MFKPIEPDCVAPTRSVDAAINEVDKSYLISPTKMMRPWTSLNTPTYAHRGNPFEYIADHSLVPSERRRLLVSNQHLSFPLVKTLRSHPRVSVLSAHTTV